MQLTRRQFLVGSAATVGLSSLPLWATGRALAAAPTVATQPLSYSSAFAMLARLSYGPTLTECGVLMQNGLEHYLDAQLAVDETSDTLANSKIAAATLHIEYKAQERPLDPKKTVKKTEEKKEGSSILSSLLSFSDKKTDELPVPMVNFPAVNEERLLNSLNKTIDQLWPLMDNDTFIDGRERRRPADEVRAANWIRAVYSKYQLREVMTEFWHNHFNVNAFSATQISATFPIYDAMLRRNSFGNFRSMLEEVAKSPAMLFFLNNARSKASPANENYARELFELHTLGADNYYNNIYNRWREVPGATEGKPIGYIDQDVYEAARAFTGWTIEDGSNTGRGTILPKTGKFTYFDGYHDNYQKRVLGTEFDPNAPPLSDGDKVLDLVAYHPGTAMFLCTKLCRRLVNDAPPPALVKRAAGVWMRTQKAPDQIAQVLRSIILSPEFSATNAIKVKRPFEFVVSFLRATGADVTPNDSLNSGIAAAGQHQYEWPSPTGHPDTAQYWLNSNSTLNSWNLLPALMTPNYKAASIDLAAQTPATIRTSTEIVNYWYERLTGRNPSPQILADLIAFLPKPENPDFVQDVQNPNFRGSLQAMVAGIALLPEFAVRG